MGELICLVCKKRALIWDEDTDTWRCYWCCSGWTDAFVQSQPEKFAKKPGIVLFKNFKGIKLDSDNVPRE